MELPTYLEDEIGACERRFRSISLSLKINRDYVAAPDAAPEDVEYFRCQVELEVLEQEYLAKAIGRSSEVDCAE